MSNIFLYLSTILIWGSTWIAVKMQIGPVPVMQSVAYRFLIAAAIIQALMSLKGRRRYGREAHMLFFALGMFLFGWNYVLFYMATSFGITTGLVAVIFSLLISMNILNAVIFFGERPSREILAGAAIGLCGIALLFRKDLAQMGFGGLYGFGVAIAVFATYLASLGNMASRRLQRDGVDVTAANGWGMTYGAVMLLLVSAATTWPLRVEMTLEYTASMAGLAVFGSVVGFWSYLTLLGRVGSAKAAYTTIIFPVWALVLSSIFEGFDWTAERLGGVALILLGNFVLLGKIRLRPAAVTPAGR